jgi:hypothetical protein
MHREVMTEQLIDESANRMGFQDVFKRYQIGG